MEEIKLIIEDYERRFETAKNQLKGLINDEHTMIRLETKASCFQTIIAELKRALNKDKTITTTIDDDDLRYQTESEKNLIYDTKTDKDICSYFDDETKDWLLNILNKKV